MDRPTDPTPDSRAAGARPRAPEPPARAPTVERGEATALVSAEPLTRGRILDADAALAALLETTVGSLRGKDLEDHLRREDPDDAGHLAEVLAGRRPRAGGLRQLLTARGAVVECHFSAARVDHETAPITAVMVSVTPVGDALRRAREDDRGANDAFDAAPYGIAIFDEWGRCTRANLAWVTLGGGVAAAADDVPALLDAVADPGAVREAVDAVAGGVRQQLTAQATTPDGSPLTVRVVLAPRRPRDATGAGAGFVAVARDVAEAPGQEPGPAPRVAARAEADTVGPGLVARTLGVSHSTVRRWIESGQLEATRTAGGHRRVARSELRRIARTMTRSGRVRAVVPPDDALPALADVLRRAGAALTRNAARATYEPDAPGWFAEPASAHALGVWRTNTARAVADGRPREAIAATRTMFATARDVATLEECVVFADRLSLLVLRRLQSDPGGAAEVGAAGQMLAAMRRSLLVLEDDRG